ncbi:MAG TPA: hypothetical protein VHO28_01770 [Ignavibacteriales bacterium]|nr:hypothetical protein [Ignavibacteriales bacterium]
MIGSTLNILSKEFTVQEFLGKGKSGFSYLIVSGETKYVYKKIHKEECPYYQFGDKLQSELNAYEKLKEAGITTPELIDYNIDKEYLIKEYINGTVGTKLIADDGIDDDIISELFVMSKMLKARNLNIDYFPANFVFSDNNLYYIDYEINPYSYEWGLENWGAFYWANSQGMKKFLQTGDSSYLNNSHDKGLPHKEPFLQTVQNWITKFS